jgi:adenylate kinase
MVLLGPPASGKGTQGRLMTERWGLPVTSIGEVLRREIADGTPLGQEAANFMNHGRLVPDWVALEAAGAWLARQERGFVLDGFPRTVGQGEGLEKILAQRQMPLTAVIWLEISEETIRERVSKRVVCSLCGQTFRIGWQVESVEGHCPICGSALKIRHDDDPKTLAERMTQYQKHTEPLIHFYEQRGLLRPIDADRESEEVFAQIEAAVTVASAATEAAA